MDTMKGELLYHELIGRQEYVGFLLEVEPGYYLADVHERTFSKPTSDHSVQYFKNIRAARAFVHREWFNRFGDK